MMRRAIENREEGSGLRIGAAVAYAAFARGEQIEAERAARYFKSKLLDGVDPSLYPSCVLGLTQLMQSRLVEQADFFDDPQFVDFVNSPVQSGAVDEYPLAQELKTNLLLAFLDIANDAPRMRQALNSCLAFSLRLESKYLEDVVEGLCRAASEIPNVFIDAWRACLKNTPCEPLNVSAVAPLLTSAVFEVLPNHERSELMDMVEQWLKGGELLEAQVPQGLRNALAKARARHRNPRFPGGRSDRLTGDSPT